MPRLLESGAIEFASGQEFLDEYHENLIRNGLFVQTDVDLPMRVKRTFTLALAALGARITIVAEPVFTSAGMMGLEVDLDPTTLSEIHSLVEHLEHEKAAAEAAPPAPEEPPGAPGAEVEAAPAVEDAPAPEAAPAAEPAAQPTPAPTAAPEATSTSAPPPNPGGEEYWDEQAPSNASPSPEVSPGVPEWEVNSPTPTPVYMPMEPPPGTPTWDVGAPTPTPIFIEPEKPAGAPMVPPAAAAAQGQRPFASASIPQLNINGLATSGPRSGEFGPLKPKAIDPDNLSEIPLFHLLGSIAQSNLPLSLRFRLGHETLIFDFNIKGKLVRFARPGSPMDLLERLEESGKLDRKTKKRVLATLGNAVTTQGIVKLLVMRRLLRAQDYWLAVRAQAIDALNDVRKLGSCPFALHTEVITRHNGISFGSLLVPWMDVALREQTNEVQEELLGAQWHRYPILASDPIWPLHALGLDPQAQSLFEEVLDGCMTLEYVRKISPLGLKRTRRLFITMICIGLLELSDDPVSEGIVLTPVDVLNRELEGRKGKTRFEQLGVHWSEHWSAYDAALARMKKEYGEGSKWYVFHEETIPICKELVKLAEVAMKFIKKKENRLKERELLATPFQRKVAGYLLFKQAELMVMRQEYRAAKLNLEVALEMEPGNREYKDLVGRC